MKKSDYLKLALLNKKKVVISNHTSDALFTFRSPNIKFTNSVANVHDLKKPRFYNETQRKKHMHDLVKWEVI